MNALIPFDAHWLTTDLRDDEWLRHYALWLAELRSRHTREAYHRSWTEFMRFTQGRNQENPPLHFGAVESQHVRLWKIALREKRQPATVNLKLSAISSFYRYICANVAYLRDDNPCDKVKQLPVNPYGKATLLQDDQDRELLGSIDRTTANGRRDFVIILLFLTTGVRLDALATATLASFQRQGAITYMHYIGKGGNEKRKRLPARMSQILWEFLKLFPPDYDEKVFNGRRYIQHMVKRRCDSVFGEGHRISVHSLRHTAAHNAAQHGSILDVRALLEHKTTRITSIYLDHVTSDQGDKMSAVLDDRYAKG